MTEKTGIRRFEDLVAWQKARILTKAIYRLTSSGPFVRDRGLREQIRRSSVSVMSNIAEGFERGGRPEFHQFLSVGKASCAELRSQLYVAFDVGYINNDTFKQLLTQAEEVARILGGLRSAVQRQRDEGRRGKRMAIISVAKPRASVLSTQS